MSALVTIEIIGAPVACADGVKDSWRDLARWIAGQIEGRYGQTVLVTYHDLFDLDCPSLPENAQLPLVLVNGQVLTSGGKVSMPAIRRRLTALGVSPNGH
jgi:hypothetical protein